jgi:hypothetical protein
MAGLRNFFSAGSGFPIWCPTPLRLSPHYESCLLHTLPFQHGSKIATRNGHARATSHLTVSELVVVVKNKSTRLRSRRSKQIRANMQVERAALTSLNLLWVSSETLSLSTSHASASFCSYANRRPLASFLLELTTTATGMTMTAWPGHIPNDRDRYHDRQLA